MPNVGHVELDAEGRTLAVLGFRNSTPNFEVWDVDKAERLFIDRLDAIGNTSYSTAALTFARGGDYVVALLNDHSLAVWRRSDWNRLFRTSWIDIGDAQLHVSENDDAIYISGRRGIVGFHLETGEKVGELNGTLCVLSEDFDRVVVKDGTVGTDGQTVYSLPSFEKIAVVPGSGRPEAIRGNQLAIYYPKESALRLLDIQDQSVLAELPAGNYPEQILLSNDGKTLVEAYARYGSPSLSVWDLKTQSRLPTCKGHFTGVQEILVDASNRDIYSFSRTEALHWKRDKHGASLEFERRYPKGLQGTASTLFGAGNKCLVARPVRGRPRSIEIRDAATWDTYTTIAPEGLSKDWADAREFSPDGTTLAVGYADGAITLRDVETGTTTQTFFTDDEARGMVFSADGKWLACRTNEKVFAWPRHAKRHTKKRLLGPPLYEHYNPAKDIGLTASGSKLVILSSRREAGGYTRIIDTNSGETLVTFWCNANAKVLAISPDDQLLAIGFGDGRIQMHSMQSGKLLIVYRSHHGGVSALTFAPNGRTLLSGGFEGLILEWKLPRERKESTL